MNLKNLFDYKEYEKRVVDLGEGNVKETMVPTGYLRDKKIICHIIIGIFLLLLLWCSFTIVPAGHVKVQSLFGKVKDNELHSGIALKNPLMRVRKMSIRTEEYTMSIAQGEGEKTEDDSISALTKEGLKVRLDITVLYRLIPDKASNVYKELGKEYKSKIIRPIIRTGIRDTIALYEAKDIYSDRRIEVTQKIKDNISVISERGIEIEDVLLRDVGLPEKLTGSIESKLTAEQDAQKMEFVLEKEKKEAERKKVEAGGIRDAQNIISEKLTQSYLKWYSIEMMKELAQSNNSTFLFVPIDKGGMPIINVQP